MKRCIGLLFLQGVIVFSSLYAETGRPDDIKAKRVNDFLNSIGVCVHVQHGQDAGRLTPLLRYTGVRNIRDAADRNYDMSGLIRLHRETGVRVVIGPGSGATDGDLPATIRMAEELHAAGALLAVEGPNEPNNFGGITYLGERGGDDRFSWMPVARFQRDLYRTEKEHPELKRYPVFGASEMGAQYDNTGLQFLTVPDGVETLMPAGTRFADYANVHNYMYHEGIWPGGPHDNQVWSAADPTSACRVDGLYGNHGRTWRKFFTGYTEDELIGLPKVTTETGVRVGDCDGAVTEELQARHYLNVYLAQFKRGWSYTFIYEFLDDPDGAFGFYRNDYETARKSAHYLHNFTAILADSSFRRRQGTLQYALPACPETVHDLLLQKGNGLFDLVIWGEMARDTASVEVVFGSVCRSVQIFDPTIGTVPVRTLEKASSVRLEVCDHPLILEIKSR